MDEHVHRHHEENMLSVEDARDKILGTVRKTEKVTIPVIDSLGLVLTDNVESTINIPPYDNSAMDGYAIRAEDVLEATPDNPTILNVIETIAAGQLPQENLKEATAARIMTGAPIPNGSNAVVPFEDTTESETFFKGGTDKIGIRVAVRENSDIRRAGGDVRLGQKVLNKGTTISSSVIAVLSSLGQDKVSVYRRPMVSIISTGDELLQPGNKPEPGKIFDSNTNGLIAAVIEAGGFPKTYGIVKDDLDALDCVLEDAAQSDLVITSAGVSKGDYDVVKTALSNRGVLNFWSIRMRPAKPLAFGTLHRSDSKKSTPLIGLPGNPVSSLVAFEQFCRPSIRKMLGKKFSNRPTITAYLTDTIRNYDGRRVYARVTIEKNEDGYLATTTGSQESNVLTSMALADGLAICPENVECQNPGDIVEVVMTSWPEEFI